MVVRMMDEHKWDFALEEAVKELETEYCKKKEKGSKEPKSKKSFFRRLMSKKKKKQGQIEKVEKEIEPAEEQNNNEAETQPKPTSPIIELKDSCNSPIMNGTYCKLATPRRQGVAERNETERQVVYRTLKNYNQINKLHDYDLV